MTGNPILPADILQEAVPGSIRRAEHFVSFLKKLVEFMKQRLKGISVTKDTPLSFIKQLTDSTGLERKPL
jgi:DNA excision repair protein ERCC-2